MKNLILPLTLCCLIAACSPAPAPTALILPRLDDRIPVTDKPPVNNPRDFQFVIVSDNTGGHRPGVFLDATRKTNLLQPEFVISVGDLIEGYTTDRALIHRQWDEFDQLADQFRAPFFYVPGNHDYTNPTMADVWKERYGRSYYHFLYHDVLFLCLNTEDGGLGHIADAQIAYAQQVLAEHPDVRWTFVMMHEPIWHEGYGSKRADWTPIETALGSRGYTVFAGHWHGYRRAIRNDRRYYILSVTGGGSRLRGEAFGEFDHVVWVSMNDQGPVIANLTLDGILPEDVVTSEQYNRVYTLSRSVGVTSEPLRVDGPISDTIELPLTIRNDSDLPLRLTGSFDSAGHVHIHPHAVDQQIEAQSSLTLPIELSHLDPGSVDSLPAINFRGFATFVLDDQPKPLRLPVRVSTGIYRPATLAGIETPPELGTNIETTDPGTHVVTGESGHLDDPQGFWTGDADCSYRFALATIPDTLYLKIRVKDEAWVTSGDRDPWSQDGIELRINPQDDAARSLDTARHEDRGKTYLFLAFSPQADGSTHFYEQDRVPEGVRVEWERSAEGYDALITIPHASLDELRADKTPWTALRVNLVVNDSDEATQAPIKLWWQPDWRSQDHQPGSGTFLRP